MSNELTGVLIGAAVALAVMLIQRAFERTDRKVEHLKAKRDRLEKTFAELNPKIAESIINGKWNTEVVMDTVFVRFPAVVSSAIMAGLGTDRSNPEKLREWYQGIVSAERESLLAIEEAIEEALTNFSLARRWWSRLFKRGA